MSLKIRRSTLIFPVNVPRFLEKAHLRGADAITLDLEDSVPPAEKNAARKLVRDAIPAVGRGGGEVLVRINNEPDLICEDVDASVYPGLTGLRLPKVESAEQIHRLDALIEAKEKERGIPPNTITISARIETPLGLLRAEAIADASSRIDCYGVGTVDWSFALGVEPSEDGIELLYAVCKVLTICKAKGIMANGLLGSVAGFKDLEGFERAVVRGKQLGLEGAGCIHPTQVPILNRVFSPSPERVAQSRRVMEAYEEGLKKGTAFVALDGKMVDIPVYYRAKVIVDRADAIDALERKKAQAFVNH